MTLDELIEIEYNKELSRVFQVYEIVKEFFGEDKVDLQVPSLKSIQKEVRDYHLSYFISGKIEDPYIKELVRNVPENVVVKLLTNKRSLVNILLNVHNILVWFPEVIITNENDRSVSIQDLYACIEVEKNGSLCGKFRLNRATYTQEQIDSNYMHSHVSDIPYSDFSNFQSCCTGDGPINATICSLQREFDEDLWNLFCLELNRYVRVESIAGTPYHYLERLGTNNSTARSESFYIRMTLPVVWHYIYRGASTMSRRKFKEFIEYVFKSDELKYSYINGTYTIGLSYVQLSVTLSNLFIEWYNKEYKEETLKKNLHMIPYTRLLERNILKKCKVNNNHIYYVRSGGNSRNYESYIGQKVCTFKGKDITLNITNIQKDEDNCVLILDQDLISFIIERILIILNYKYGKENRINSSASDNPCQGIRVI